VNICDYGSRSKYQKCYFLPTEIIQQIYEFVGIKYAFDLRVISNDFNLPSNSCMWKILAEQKKWIIPHDKTAFQFCLERVTIKKMLEKYLNFIRKFIREFREPDPNHLIELSNLATELEYTIPYDVTAFYEICGGLSITGAINHSPSFYSACDCHECKRMGFLDINLRRAKSYLHKNGRATIKWLTIGSEAEYDILLLCCDSENADFGAVSCYAIHRGDGEYVASSLTKLFEEAYKGFKLLSEHFSENEIHHFLENDLIVNGLSSQMDGTALDILCTIRGWKNINYTVDREMFFNQCPM
jgi:hypothetical protein